MTFGSQPTGAALDPEVRPRSSAVTPGHGRSICQNGGRERRSYSCQPCSVNSGPLSNGAHRTRRPNDESTRVRRDKLGKQVSRRARKLTQIRTMSPALDTPHTDSAGRSRRTLATCVYDSRGAARCSCRCAVIHAVTSRLGAHTRRGGCGRGDGLCAVAPHSSGALVARCGKGPVPPRDWVTRPIPQLADASPLEVTGGTARDAMARWSKCHPQGSLVGVQGQ